MRDVNDSQDRPGQDPPFVPRGERAPLFFLHIPKSAGTTVNALLTRLYGAQNCVLHAEWAAQMTRSGRGGTTRADGVSGHLPLAEWAGLAGQGAYGRVTLLRDPWERLVSHLNWMDRFNQGHDAATLARLSPAQARIVAILAETDFADPGSVAAMMARMAAPGLPRYFDNLQIRMLHPTLQPGWIPAVGPEDVAEARLALDGFALVGRAEAAADFAHALARLAGHARAPRVGRENRARSARIAADDRVARAALAAWWEPEAALLAAAGPLIVAQGGVPARRKERMRPMGMGWILRRIGLGATDARDAAPDQPAAAPAAPVIPRPVPFVPRGQVAPLFFLHIPKTSGSSINAFLQALYGEDNFQDHVEYRLPLVMRGEIPTMVLDGVSGHVPLCRWSLYRGSDAYARATVLRDPWARLVSHINWVNRYNIDKPLPPPDSPRAQADHTVAAILRGADLATRPGLEAFRDAVSAVPDFVAFDNLQVRLLLTGSVQAESRALRPQDVENAAANLAGFAVVGFCEDQPRFQRDLRALLGKPGAPSPIHENEGRAGLLSPANTLAREILAPWFALDQALYDAVRG